MNHQTYLTERSGRDPRFADERKAAIAELALGELLVDRRMERNLSVEQLAEVTGISKARLDDIEAGESLTLHEVLWLVHALDLDVMIGPGFMVSSGTPISEEKAADLTTFASRPSRETKAATA